MADKDFDHRTVIVTGGTGALGTAVVKTLLDRGATVHVTQVPEESSRRFTLADRVGVHVVDLRDEAAVSALYAQLDGLWASIHVAGGFAVAPVADTSAKDLHAMFDLNALTCFLCCREAIRSMRKSSAGRIVNVAARPAVAPVGGMVAYSASKAAVASITQSLAEEVKPEGILVNAVVPSIMDTHANRAAMPQADFARWPKVEQVAAAIAYLASPANALTTGALVPVYGQA